MIAERIVARYHVGAEWCSRYSAGVAAARLSIRKLLRLSQIFDLQLACGGLIVAWHTLPRGPPEIPMHILEVCKEALIVSVTGSNITLK